MASAYNATQTFTNSTDANFRSWITFIADNLQIGGFIKTGDAGQINTATVLRPTVSGTMQGYEIRRMSDTLQATKPVFMKIEYGSMGFINSPGIYITLGTGSDGAGNITGIILARSSQNIGASTDIASCPARVSSNTNRFVIAFAYTTTAAGTGVFIFGLERTKTSALADEGTGLLLVRSQQSAAGYLFQLVPFVGVAPTAESTGGAIHPSADTTIGGADVGIFPLQFMYFGYKVYPSTNFFCYRTNEILIDTVQVVDVNGVNISYATCGQRHQVSERTVNNPGMMFRYD